MSTPYREAPSLAEQLAEAQREIERLKKKPPRRDAVLWAMWFCALVAWNFVCGMNELHSAWWIPAVSFACVGVDAFFACFFYRLAFRSESAK